MGVLRDEAASPPAVLTGRNIADLLTGPLKRQPDAARAAAELTKALVAFANRRADDLYLYECVQNFRRHLAYAARSQLADGEHPPVLARAGDELVEKVLAKYRRAGEHEQDGRWDEAREAYRQVLPLAPEPDSELGKNVRKHMDYCRHRQSDERRRQPERTREGDDAG